MTILLIDNYDSFTHNLSGYLKQLGAQVEVWRNDAFTLDQVDELRPKGILLSPGPGRPEDAGLTMGLIDRFINSIPLLGICLGHQALGVHHGATLVTAKDPMHGKTSKVVVSDDPLFRGWQEKEVMRYHSLILDIPGTGMEVIATTSQDQIMGIRNTGGTAYGLQFHPESIGTPNGQVLLRNWLNMLN